MIYFRLMVFLIFLGWLFFAIEFINLRRSVERIGIELKEFNRRLDD